MQPINPDSCNQTDFIAIISEMVSHCGTIDLDVDSKSIKMWSGLLIFGAFLGLLFFNLKEIWARIEQLYRKYLANSVELDGCEVQVFLGLLSSFLPARFGWSPAWLLGSYPLSVYLVETFRTGHMRKRIRIAHSMPLPVVDHSTPVRMTLKVTIIKASLLAAALEEGGCSDPYVKIELRFPGEEPQSSETSVKSRTSCPVWNEDFTFELSSTSHIRLAQITLILMDKDFLKSDNNGSCATTVQDVVNASTPDVPWVHRYPIRRHENGRTYATLDVEWQHSFNAPADPPRPSHPQVVDERQGGTPSESALDGSPVGDDDSGPGATGSALWAAAEAAFPSAVGALLRTRTLDRGDHLVAATAASFALGILQWDWGLLLPLVLATSRLEALRAAVRLRKAQEALGRGDERLKQVDKWLRAAAGGVGVPADELPRVLRDLRRKLPQSLVDVQAQALSGVLQHFWSCHTDWLTGYVCNQVEKLVPGLIVEEILPGSTGPAVRNVVCTTASPGDYPRTRDRIRITVLQAKGIQSSDFLSGLSDPYVTISQTSGKVAGKTVRTRAIKNTLTPSWDQVFEFVLGSEEEKFEFKIFDEDLVGMGDELLGVFELDGNAIVGEMDSPKINSSSITKTYDVDQKNSKQKSIQLDLGIMLVRTSVRPKELKGRLQFIDMDLCWNPCQLEVKVRYPMGITFKASIKVSKIVIPARVVLEWKSCSSDDVPTLANIKQFPEKYPQMSGGRSLSTAFEVFQVASKYYKVLPNMDRVWFCMTAKPIISLDENCSVGDIEKYLQRIGIFDLNKFIGDTIFNSFPVCCDLTKPSSARAQQGTLQGNLAALLDPVRAGAWQRKALLFLVVKSARLAEVSTCYCVATIEDTESLLNSGSKNERTPIITHASWDSGLPRYMKSGGWWLRDLARERIRIELWKKDLQHGHRFDELIGTQRLALMDFIYIYQICHDDALKEVDLDMGRGNRLLIAVQIKTLPMFCTDPESQSLAEKPQEVQIQRHWGSGTLVLRTELIEPSGLAEKVTASPKIDLSRLLSIQLQNIQSTVTKNDCFHQLQAEAFIEKKADDDSCHFVRQILFELSQDPSSFNVQFTWNQKFESLSLKSLIHAEGHNDTSTVFRTETLFKENSSNSNWTVKAHISFLPYSKDEHPSITLSILRAHNIHDKSGSDLRPVYSQVELLTAVKKNHDAIQSSSSERLRFQRVDIQNQRQMSEVSDENHGNAEWNACNSFDLYVSSDMLRLGHDCEQMIKMSIWQKKDDGSSQELGSHMISVLDLHMKYYSIAGTAEVEFSVLSGAQSGSESAVSPSHQPSNVKFRAGKKCCLVANLKFNGDWSEHLEVLNLEKIAKLKESKRKKDNLKSDIIFECSHGFPVQQRRL